MVRHGVVAQETEQLGVEVLVSAGCVVVEPELVEHTHTVVGIAEVPSRTFEVFGVVIGDGSTAGFQIVLIEHGHVGEEVVGNLRSTNHVDELLVGVSGFVCGHPNLIGGLHGVAYEVALAVCKLNTIRHLRIGADAGFGVNQEAVVELL